MPGTIVRSELTKPQEACSLWRMSTWVQQLWWRRLGLVLWPKSHILNKRETPKLRWDFMRTFIEAEFWGNWISEDEGGKGTKHILLEKMFWAKAWGGKGCGTVMALLKRYRWGPSVGILPKASIRLGDSSFIFTCRLESWWGSEGKSVTASHPRLSDDKTSLLMAATHVLVTSGNSG